MHQSSLSQKYIPEIYAAISLVFGTENSEQDIINGLNDSGIFDIKICRPQNEQKLIFNIAVVYYKRFWYLDDALSEMFLKVKGCLNDIKRLVSLYHGEIYIDIAFTHFEAYPALIFSGENMKIIHYLDANISIDPY